MASKRLRSKRLRSKRLRSKKRKTMKGGFSFNIENNTADLNAEDNEEIDRINKDHADNATWFKINEFNKY